MWVQSLGQKDPLEEGMGTPSSILAWRTPWTEEPGGLWSIESQKVGHNLADRETYINLGRINMFMYLVFPYSYVS